MSELQELKSHLKSGGVYRREELEELSPSVDRVLKGLLSRHLLEKAAPGLYYVPKKTAFGLAPPSEDELVGAFLKDNDSYNFLRKLNGTVITGKTETNVGDLLLVLGNK